MNRYINVTININLLTDSTLDLRIPNDMTVKELLNIVFESYQIDCQLVNPSLRVIQTGQVLFGTSHLETVKDGMLLTLETV